MPPEKKPVKMKVFSGHAIRSGSHESKRCLVAAPSRKRAAEMLNESKVVGGRMSERYMREYWAETQNAIALQVAADGGEGIWLSDDRFVNSVNDYKRVWPKAQE